MKDSKLRIKYTIDNKIYEDDRYQNQHYCIESKADNNGVKLIISPKTKMQLISFDLEYQRKFQNSEVFFLNGYQSWSTTKEVHKEETEKGLIRGLRKFKPYVKMASTSGDYLFADYPKKNQKGFFHSYTYTYIRNGVDVEFYGSMNERTGFTVFYVDMQNGLFRIHKDVEGVNLLADTYELLNVVKLVGTYDEVFDKYFNLLPQKKPSRISFLAGYTSWYNLFGKITEETILRDFEGIKRVKDSVNIFQIDDGYCKVGDWLEPDSEKFLVGMKTLADKIHDEGLLAGLWLAPFNAAKTSKIVKEHPDWFLKDEKGKYILGCLGWGGAWVLDLYSIPVREHIKKVFDVVLNEWGYDMVKLDFLYSQCMVPRNGKSRGQIMCEAMDFLRECVGEKLLLGCGVPLGPAFGYVDACRISCDVDLSYAPKFYNKMKLNRELPSAQNAINNSIFRRHLNRIFLNDPDVFFMRNDNIQFSLEQKKLLAKINNLFGKVLFVSDNIGDFDDEQLENVIQFFKESQAEIISVESLESDFISIKYKIDGELKKLEFYMSTGEVR